MEKHGVIFNLIPSRFDPEAFSSSCEPASFIYIDSYPDADLVQLFGLPAFVISISC